MSGLCYTDLLSYLSTHLISAPHVFIGCHLTSWSLCAGGGGDGRHDYGHTPIYSVYTRHHSGACNDAPTQNAKKAGGGGGVGGG